MAFAGAVMLGDLDDFIAPSQACVNPLFAQKPATGGSTDTKASAKLALDSDLLLHASTAPAKPDLIRKGAGSTAKVSLADCLACSGCVTSAETVLITQQSVAEFRRALADESFSVHVVSFAPQALASIAAAFNIDSASCFKRLTTFLAAKGVRHVLDTSACVDLALLEACREFVDRLRAQPADGAGPRPPWTAPPPSRAISSTRTEAVAAAAASASATPSAVSPPVLPAGDASPPPPPLPLLCSACPGWVCYAEKAVPEALPFLSAVKSPQQLIGSLVKFLLSGGDCGLPQVGVATNAASAVGETPVEAAPALSPVPAARIYHTTVMPCYDKKLEASRADFFWEAPGCREVDCVLSASEFVELVTEDAGHLSALPETPRRGVAAPSCSSSAAPAPAAFCVGGIFPAAAVNIDVLFCGLDAEGSKFVGPTAVGGTSDAFVETLARYCALTLGGRELDEAVSLPYTAGRNADFQELRLSVPRGDGGGDAELRFALAYGFRNIQTVLNRVKRVKTGSPPWHYVEVMACPGGCANGGGQARATAVAVAAAVDGGSGEGAVDAGVAPLTPPGASAAASKSRLLAEVSARLHDRAVVRPWRSPAVAAIERAVLGSCLPAQAAHLLRTRFHHVPKLETTLIRW